MIVSQNPVHSVFRPCHSAGNFLLAITILNRRIPTSFDYHNGNACKSLSIPRTDLIAPPLARCFPIPPQVHKTSAGEFWWFGQVGKHLACPVHSSTKLHCCLLSIPLVNVDFSRSWTPDSTSPLPFQDTSC
jgi:hypothetical protein